MSELPVRKVGIIACSGEELAEGTVTRQAALKVLNALRPHNTVTICLPLFLAGGEGDRAFARVNPTITVDGCELRCAARATEMYSGKPAASVVVSELVAEHGLGKPEGLRRLNEAGQRAAQAAAERVAALVDEVLEEKERPAAGDEAAPGHDQGEDKAAEAVCSCGSGIPVKKLVIEGQTVEVLALPLILKRFFDAGRQPDEALAHELMEIVKVYNQVPSGAEGSYREAVLQEYAAFCKRKKRE